MEHQLIFFAEQFLLFKVWSHSKKILIALHTRVQLNVYLYLYVQLIVLVPIYDYIAVFHDVIARRLTWELTNAKYNDLEKPIIHNVWIHQLCRSRI